MPVNRTGELWIRGPYVMKGNMGQEQHSHYFFEKPFTLFTFYFRNANILFDYQGARWNLECLYGSGRVDKLVLNALNVFLITSICSEFRVFFFLR